MITTETRTGSVFGVSQSFRFCQILMITWAGGGEGCIEVGEIQVKHFHKAHISMEGFLKPTCQFKLPKSIICKMMLMCCIILSLVNGFAV